jgi:hypothetical protein
MKNLFRPSVIIGTLPVTLANATTADATQVMSDLNWIVNEVNANASALSNTALLNATNNFTVVQSGVNATAAANFPVASQVQNSVFQTLTSTLGTNTITARCAALPLTAYATGQVFTFIPSQNNTGAVGITIDSAGSSSIFSGGFSMPANELVAGVPALITRDSSKFDLINGRLNQSGAGTTFLGADVDLNNTANFFAGPDTGSIGVSGQVWEISAVATMIDSAGIARLEAAIYNGAAYICGTSSVSVAAGNEVVVTLSAIVTLTAATTFSLRAKDQTSTNGKLLTTSTSGTVTNKATSISAKRLA